MSELHDVTFTLNGKPVAAKVEARLHLADFLRHTLRADRNAYRLRARRVRRMQHHDRWTLRAKLPDARGPGRRVGDRNHRRTDGAERHRRSAARVRRPQCLAVWLLHARYSRHRGGVAWLGASRRGAGFARLCQETTAAVRDIRRSSMRSKPLRNCPGSQRMTESQVHHRAEHAAPRSHPARRRPGPLHR